MQAHSEFLVSCTKIGMLAQTGTSLRLGSCTCRVWIHVVDFKWRPLYPWQHSKWIDDKKSPTVSWSLFQRYANVGLRTDVAFLRANFDSEKDPTALLQLLSDVFAHIADHQATDVRAEGPENTNARLMEFLRIIKYKIPGDQYVPSSFPISEVNESFMINGSVSSQWSCYCGYRIKAVLPNIIILFWKCLNVEDVLCTSPTRMPAHSPLPFEKMCTY